MKIPKSDIPEIWEAVKLAHGKPSKFNPLNTKTIKENVVGAEGEEVTIYSSSFGTIVVFHGSDDKLDWTRNAKVEEVDEGRMEGFADGYDSVEEEVFTYLRLIGASKRPLYITGYSRGGVLAAYLFEEIVYPAFCVTFASPNPYHNKFRGRDEYLDDITNITLKGDLVPHFWPQYYKPGETIQLGKVGFLKRWLRRVVAAWATKRAKGVIGLVGVYHSYESYDKALKEWL